MIFKKTKEIKNINNLIKDIKKDASLKLKFQDLGLYNHNSYELEIIFNEDLTDSDIDSLELLINNNDPYELKFQDLLIAEYLEDTSTRKLEDIPKTNFTLLGLEQQGWVLEKGRRTVRNYLNESGEVVCSDNFSYHMDEDFSYRIDSFQRYLLWFDKNGEVALRKDKKIKLSTGRIAQLNKQVRINQIDYLTDAGINLKKLAKTLPSPQKEHYLSVAEAVLLLILHYDKYIDEYKKIGGEVFRNAVEGESDSSIIALLGTVVNEEGQTAKDVILSQVD